MPTTYRLADPGDQVRELLAAVMEEHHPDLHTAGVKVGVLMAFNAEGDAVKASGYPALATMKPCNARERASKDYDCELVVDEIAYRDLRDRQRAALLDHELSHVALVPLSVKELQAAQAYDAAAPWWKLDDTGRPRLKSVKGDWMAGDGFAAVIERHGEHAAEFLNLERCWRRAEQAAGKRVEMADEQPGEVPTEQPAESAA